MKNEEWQSILDAVQTLLSETSGKPRILKKFWRKHSRGHEGVAEIQVGSKKYVLVSPVFANARDDFLSVWVNNYAVSAAWKLHNAKPLTGITELPDGSYKVATTI